MLTGSDIYRYGARSSRGFDKVMNAGVYPMAISLERRFSDLPGDPLRVHARPKLLHENAVWMFELEQAG